MVRWWLLQVVGTTVDKQSSQILVEETKDSEPKSWKNGKEDAVCWQTLWHWIDEPRAS